MQQSQQVREVVIVSAVRTPIGAFGGALASQSAPQLGAVAIKGALEKAGVDKSDVTAVIMGNVLSAGVGQAPARQAAILAGLAPEVECTTVNKVCASGSKAIMMAAQDIMLGMHDVVVAGGMESMSNVPYYASQARFGSKFGNVTMLDGIAKDGLEDVYKGLAMGHAADNTAKEMNLTREAQDAYAIESYTRAQNAQKAGAFQDEIVAVPIPQRGGEPLLVSQDEEPGKSNFGKMPGLRPAFDKAGTVTAANASKLNDGAAAVVLMSREKADQLGIQPIAVVRGFADAEQDPWWFTTTPSIAIPKAMKRAGITPEQVDYYEINEAFSAVALANNEKLGLDAAKVNVNGGAVALGHPLGASGARIVTTLLNVLKQKGAKIGVTGICNGGGGASALVLERV